MNPLDYFYAIPPIFFKMWVKYISIYTNIISFQRLFPILLILNILCKHTQHASFFSQTRLPILFSSSPLHGLIVDETRNCMTVKKKRREREKKKRREQFRRALSFTRALLSAIYADTHSAYFHCTRLLLTVFPPSIIPLYRYRFIVPTVFLPRRLSQGYVQPWVQRRMWVCVWERESNSVHCLYRWYQVQYVSLINLNQIQYQRL